MTASRPQEVSGVEVPYALSLKELQALITSDVTRRWAAMVALAHSENPGAVQALRDLASAPDAHVRRFALELLGRKDGDAMLTELVLKGLGDPDEHVVRTALHAAGNHSIVEARPAVLHSLVHGTPSTRQVALTALETIAQAEDFDTLVSTFKSDPSIEVRRASGWTLFKRRTSNLAPRLFALWHADPLPRHRGWACRLATEFPSAEFGERLLALSLDLDGHVRKAAKLALRALAQRG